MTSNDLTLALTLVLVVGCGGNATSNFGGRSGAGGNESGGASSGGKAAASSGGAGHGGQAANAGSGLGGRGGGRGGAAGTTETGGVDNGRAGAGGATGGAGQAGNGGGEAGTDGSSAGRAAAGASGENSGGEAGSTGEHAVECTGATPYFPEFDRSCASDGDCVAVIHQTNCCGSEEAFGIRASEQSAFTLAEATCDAQYPACGCASFGIDVEDGTRIDFTARDQIAAACDAGTCKAHYAGTSFACGTLRCTEQQYCVQSSGGPAATPVSYSCDPTACTDCSCLTMTDCTCSGIDGQLTLVCQQP